MDVVLQIPTTPIFVPYYGSMFFLPYCKLNFRYFNSKHPQTLVNDYSNVMFAYAQRTLKFVCRSRIPILRWAKTHTETITRHCPHTQSYVRFQELGPCSLPGRGCGEYCGGGDAEMRTVRGRCTAYHVRVYKKRYGGGCNAISRSFKPAT